MGDIDTAVRGAQKLELLLEERFGAEGRGLHEKLSSVEGLIPARLVRRVRWIASLRNRVVHEGAAIKDVEDFELAVQESLEALSELPVSEHESAPPAPAAAHPPVPRRRAGSNVGLVVFVVLAAFGFVAFLLVSGRPSAPRADLVSNTQSSLPVQAAEQEAATESAAPVVSGSLAALAKRASADAAQAHADIDSLWSTLQASTHVTLGAVDVKDNGDGTSDVLAPVTWTIDARPILTTLNKYFWDYDHRSVQAGQVDFSDHMGETAPGISVKRLWNEPTDAKRPFSPDLFEYLTRRLARIRVAAGARSGTLTIAAGRKCFVSCDELGKDQFQVHLSNQQRPQLVLLSSYRGDQNPVRIARVPTDELAQIAKLAVTVEVVAAP